MCTSCRIGWHETDDERNAHMVVINIYNILAIFIWSQNTFVSRMGTYAEFHFVVLNIVTSKNILVSVTV